MFFNPKKYKIFFYNKFVDMRKGHSTLSQLITNETKFEITDGSLFLFVSKNKRTIKGLYFDGTGLTIIHKKLQAGRFMSFENCKTSLEVNQNEFNIIFHGGHIPLSRSGERIKLQIA